MLESTPESIAMIPASQFLISLWLVFVSALTLSLGHCVGMCGGIVLAFSSLPHVRILSHALYHIGRLCSYICVGVVFALLGRAFALHHFWREFASLIVGVLLIGYALCFAFFPKILALLEPNIKCFPLFVSAFSAALRSRSILGGFVLGVLNGLLPCGLVYFFALYTLNGQIPQIPWLSSEAFGGVGVVFSAVCVMGVFWLGGLPSMIGVGILGRLLSAYRKQFMLLSIIAMLALGLWNIYAGITTMWD